MPINSELVPLLIVEGAARAIDFYVRALGAEVLARYEHGPERHISHADLSIAGAAFAVTEEARAWNSDAPTSLGGSPVVMQLSTNDVDALLASACQAGATSVYPAQELAGERMARVRDPFGHLWIFRQRVQTLTQREIQRQRDELFAAFSRLPVEEKPSLRGAPQFGQAQRPPGRIHLLIGPVGAGKSTFGRKLAETHAAVRLTLDEWMPVLFSPDRPESGVVEWYVERAARCVDQIWSVAKSVARTGVDVVLEIGLLQRSARLEFYERVSVARLMLTVHVLEAERDVRRARVERRNHERGATFSMIVPPHVFELASDHWQPPDEGEREARDMRFIRTD